MYVPFGFSFRSPYLGGSVTTTGDDGGFGKAFGSTTVGFSGST